MTTNHRDKKSIYEEITERIIDSLETGVIPWARPWEAALYGEHRNADTNRPYRGLNIMLLNLVGMMKGFVDPRWLTYRNAEKLGGHVRKGEKGVGIVFWKFLPVKDRQDHDDDHVADSDDSDRKVIPFARMYTVFNVEQCEDLDLPSLEVTRDIDDAENRDAERILSLPTMKHGGGQAYYSKAKDFIAMPVREAFENLDFYYATAYHEIVHWTGHPARLQRQFGKRFGDQDYAFEELVAEIGASFLGASTGIPFEEMRHPGYIDSWLRILKQDNRAIFTAAAKAQAAADFVLAKADLAAEAEEDLPEAA